MCKKEFKKAISRDDIRLHNPQLAVFVVPTEFGPVIPLIKRRKYFFDKKGNPILDQNKKPVFEQWFDLPGGKADPIFDPDSLAFEKSRIEELKKKFPKTKEKPEDKAKIIDVEAPNNAAKRETWEETGIHVTIGAGDKLTDGPHPAKKGLQRQFHKAIFCGGKMDNMVPNEHDYVVPMDPENAVVLLGGRIPQEVKDYILAEGERIREAIASGNIVDLAIYRDQKFNALMIEQGYEPMPMVA